jgi:hypothetical protein
MADPASIHPEQFEILATRTVRGAGMTIDHPRLLDASDPDPETGDFTLRLRTTARSEEPPSRLLLECRRNTHPIGANELEKLAERYVESRVAVFATGGYDAAASARAAELGMTLYVVVDAKASHAAFGFAGQIPSWLPEFTAQRVGGPTR